MKFFVATALVATLAVVSADSAGCARGKFGVYANPTDCSKYVMCVAGAPVAVTCPRGMKFDSRIGTCSPFAKCKVAAPVEEPVHEEPHHEEPVHEEPHHEEPVHEEPHHEEPAHEEPHHEEPAHEEPAAPAKFTCPRSVGRFADAEDCKRYYVCKDGEAAHYQCPFKLNFSSKLGMCLPGVKCTVKVEEPVHEEPAHEEPHHEEPHHEEPEEPHHEEPHHEEPEEPHHEEPHHEEPEEPHHEEPAAPAKFSCPRAAGRFADPENCKRYYICKDGDAAHYQCPFKLNFSSKLGMCLPGVKCAVKVEEPVHEEPHHEEPHHEEPHHEEPEEPHHEEPHHEEPEEPHHEEPHHEEPVHEEPAQTGFACQRSNGLFADVHNCRQFYMCKDGQAEHKRCPLNFRFSRTLGMCLPGVKCVEEPKHEEPIHHEEPEEPIHHEEPEEPIHHEEPEEPHHHEEPEEPHHHEEPEEPIHHEEPEEPVHHEEPTKFACKKSFGLFADAKDCHSYYMCVRGRAHKVTCPTNSNYDFINRHCIAAANARCMKKDEDVKIEEEEPVMEEKKFECPVDFGFYPSSDCRKFIQCAHGVAHEMACPANTEWNQESQACDHMSARCAAQ